VEENGEMVHYDNQTSIEEKIMENNEMQFHLTETTPLMQEPLVSELGNMADTSAADWILQGTYVCPPGVDWYTQEFISSLQITTPISDEDRIHTMVTCQD
jgi:hypothetical protein